MSLLCKVLLFFFFTPQHSSLTLLALVSPNRRSVHVFLAKLKRLKLKRNPLLSTHPFTTVRANVPSNNSRGQIIIVIKTESFSPAVKIQPLHIFAWTSGLFCAPLIVTLLWPKYKVQKALRNNEIAAPNLSWAPPTRGEPVTRRELEPVPDSGTFLASKWFGE